MHINCNPCLLPMAQRFIRNSFLMLSVTEENTGISPRTNQLVQATILRTWIVIALQLTSCSRKCKQKSATGAQRINAPFFSIYVTSLGSWFRGLQLECQNATSGSSRWLRSTGLPRLIVCSFSCEERVKRVAIHGWCSAPDVYHRGKELETTEVGLVNRELLTEELLASARPPGTAVTRWDGA